MAAVATALVVELEAPPKLEEEDLDLLAFQLWQQASCPENPVNENWMSEEEALRSHSSCL
jgi:hypothetical protein